MPDKKTDTPEDENYIIPTDIPEPVETVQPVVPNNAPVQEPLLKKHVAFFKSKKGRITLAVVGVLVLVVAVLMSIPATRDAILGSVIKKDVAVVVLDSKTTKPVSDVTLNIAGQTTKTNANGEAQLKSIPVGDKKVEVKKKYYKDTYQAVAVPIFTGPDKVTIKLEATGRQVPVKVVNKLSGKPVAKAVISALDTITTTDADGVAVLVLPANKKTEKGTVKLSGYNELAVDIQITDQKDDKNTFTVLPRGKLYFLSKRTGKINVMKSNLDGSSLEIVITGTGKESDTDTILLAARDWRYLALKSRRDSDKAKIYLIDTANDKMSVIDEGNADFSAVGWHNENFIFTVERTAVKNWQPKKAALKSFNAKTGKLSTLDETGGVGTSDFDYAYENIQSVYILDNLLVYVKDWVGGYYSNGLVADKKLSIVSIKPSGENRRILKEFSESNSAYANARLYKPQELYFEVSLDGKSSFYEYENDKIGLATGVNSETFAKAYPTFILSPSGQKTFWSESRDGKKTLFVGSANAKDPKEVAVLSDYTPYGWYGDEYLFVSKNKSELYVLPQDGASKSSALKITDYHKPDFDFAGYGYGYGGF